MTTSTTMTRPSLTTADLEDCGLQPDQVARLADLREVYSPFHEHFDEREFQQLNFLRWRIEHGIIASGSDDR